MTAVVLDKWLEKRLIARRRRLGTDRFDEVWDGVYVMAPAADIEHFSVSFDLASVLNIVVKAGGLGEVFTGVNISDRKDGWKKNFRIPDISVYLKDNLAEDCGTHWSGGPDLAVEIVSPKDRSRKKIPFYEKIGTRELLIVDRKPWRLTLLRLTDGKLRVAGESTAMQPLAIASDVIPVSLAIVDESEPPRIIVRHLQDGRQWTVDARSSRA